MFSAEFFINLVFEGKEGLFTKRLCKTASVGLVGSSVFHCRDLAWMEEGNAFYFY